MVFVTKHGKRATMRPARVRNPHSGPLAGLLERPPKPIDKNPPK
jgi:hypothetical protein